MQKTYVLDTNILIDAPHALDSFEDNHIVLPLAVLEELDGLKMADGETGANARAVIRKLEALRLKGQLCAGIDLPTGGSLRIEINHREVDLPPGLDQMNRDRRILQVTKGLAEQGGQVILVTRDIVLRIKAQILGLLAEDFTTDQIDPQETIYSGRKEVYVPDEALDNFKNEGLDASLAYLTNEVGDRQLVDFYDHQFIILRSDTQTKKTMLGRYRQGRLIPLTYQDERPFGVKPRSVGQYFLQEALMLPVDEAPLVIVKGPAGTAKTFYALAVGLDRVLEGEKVYRKILISRPNAQFDKDIGFLPGSEQEKISPLLRPIIDNLENLLSTENNKDFKQEQEVRSRINYLLEAGIVTAEAMNFMRGRSICNTWFILDEAQNLSPNQVKGIITRVGQGSKVVLLGDPQQIDNPHLNYRSNGLSYASQHMKGSPLCAQVTLLPQECERSDLALDAALRM